VAVQVPPTVVHPPKLFPDPATETQVLFVPHSKCVAPAIHLLSVQVDPVEQTLAHVPQLLTSVCLLVQVVPHKSGVDPEQVVPTPDTKEATPGALPTGQFTDGYEAQELGLIVHQY